MGRGFGGEVAEFYGRYRRGYPSAVVDALVEAFGLGRDDVVLDLGCGTGQLTLPVAERVRTVVGMDPEPDMLARGRQAGREQGRANVCWLLGADTDLPAFGALVGERTLGAVTIGQALHWMDHGAVFGAAAPLVRRGGGVAVIANGAPLWLQETAWSRALREVLERWLARSLTHTCGTDTASQQRYAAALSAAGFTVREMAIEYTDRIDLDQLLGGVYSAFSVEQLPTPDQRQLLADQVRQALHPHDRFTEQVRVRLLLGTVS